MVHACAGGLFWQAVEQRCDWIANVNCQHRDCEYTKPYIVFNANTIGHSGAAEAEPLFLSLAAILEATSAATTVVE